jgi:ubiquinone/menaquinone biosynthesis C-methylase UbiE
MKKEEYLKTEKTNYDNIAETFIEQAERNLSWNNLYERPYMLSIFDNFKNKRVLDLGCGTGFYSFHALKQNADVTAADASIKMLDHIKSRDSEEKISLHKADLSLGLPFIESESADYIICSLVLHYIENWNMLVNDMYRVLKKHGKIYISTHHPFTDYLHLKKKSYFDKYFFEDTWGSKEKPFKVYYYTRPLADIIKPFIDSSFNIVKIDEPLPSEECKKTAPQIYRKLIKIPAFLFLILQK